MKEKRKNVIDIILRECQTILIDTNKNIDYKYGNPPDSVVVKLLKYYKEDIMSKLKYRKIRSVWEINKNNIISITDLSKQTKYEPISGMYFNQGEFLVSLKPNLKKFILIIRFGPRNGSVWRYVIDLKKFNEPIKKDKFMGIF